MGDVPDDTTVTTTITLEGAVNARDLAGLPLADGARVAPRVLLRSDNLQDLTPQDIRVLVEDHALRTVIDLRTEFEIASEGPGPLAEDPRVRIQHHSLYPATGGGTDLDLATIKPWGDNRGAELPGETPTVRAYLGYLERRPDSIVAALRAIAETDGATLIHCAAGKDRTGTVVALALAAAGAPREAIAADYEATTHNIDAIVRRLAATKTYAAEMDVDDVARHSPPPGTMERVLELLDRDHGGAEAWLLSAGLTAEELARLRARLAGS
ncbi:MAG: protein-tyrosine-phosphatase [Solirubrobacterales bacterium]|nr:protein-tyrosine-phosphatase [Solirubrobacterales bacterium]